MTATRCRLLDLAGVDAADGDAADVVGVVERGHLHLQRLAGAAAVVGRRDVLHDGFEQRDEVLAGDGEIGRRPALRGRRRR